ncbi:MAG: MFS transporter [Pseudomonadota bacterium]
MRTIRYLSGAAYGMHFADQITLVSVPLIAALAFGASPSVIGILVACQSAAHLLGSVPFGLLVDRRQLRTLALVSGAMALCGCFIASLSVSATAILSFGIGVTLAGFGAVLFGLTSLSILPKAVPPEGLARANAAIEIPRALWSFLVPLAIGLFMERVALWSVFAFAVVGAAFALALMMRLPRFEVVLATREPALASVREGGWYVLGHNLLLPISLCSVFWNFAFAALLVALVPVIQEVYFFESGSFGISLAAFGLAAVLGSWTMGRVGNAVAPSMILIGGPASSVVAAVALLLIGPESDPLLLYAAFFLLGFGPSMWLVVQNSIRQLVAPPAMLGRVNAVIQTAIYGIRPLGALAGGFAAGTWGPEAALVLVMVAYGASLAASFLGGLRRVSSFEMLRAPVVSD